MSSFRVVAIPSEVAEQVRNTGKSPNYGFPAHREIAAGRAPCRHCLKLIRKDEEELLLFTYDPFRELGEPPLPGPVYIHAAECPRHPENDVIPEDYRGRLLTLEGYGDDRALVKEIRVRDGAEERAAEELFGETKVRYVNVRSTEAGCFLFRLERN
ncbi:MAG TPA: DUF1203 domain-containing protein [Candidatus Acidoferrum sp.]|nr:DUF1203 domain-containing protein [Candidatus Acidoferrum sp.]